MNASRKRFYPFIVTSKLIRYAAVVLLALCLPTWQGVEAATIMTIAGDVNGSGGSTGDGGPATAAKLNYPYGVALDGAGNLYIADYNNNRVRRVDTSGIIDAFAGTGLTSYSGPYPPYGDGGPALEASLLRPSNLLVDSAGNLFIADAYRHRVRKVDTDGTITTYSGTGTAGSAVGQFSRPWGLAMDPAGNLYVSEYGNHRISKVAPDGSVTIVAGTAGLSGATGDGGPAVDARLFYPAGITLDEAGNLFVADSGNNVVRMIGTTGLISTVAGNFTADNNTPTNYYDVGDDGPATSATVSKPMDVAFDTLGNLLVADFGNNRLRKVATSGTAGTFGNITTIAGTGNPNPALTAAGDGGPATEAELNKPGGVCVDPDGFIFVSENYGRRIRKIDADIPNDPPVATADFLVANEDSPLDVTLSASDSDGTVIGYEIGIPPGHGVLSGSGSSRVYAPQANFSGADFFTYRAIDNRGATSEWASIDIIVSPVNDVPTIGGVPTTTADSGSLYQFLPTANDVDGDMLTFSVSNPPGWASFDPSSGRLSGTPAKVDAGTTYGIVISVADGNGAEASLPAFDLTVQAVNHPPAIAGTPATSVNADSPYTFQPEFSDIDGDQPSYSIVNLPVWANFDASTGELSGTPSNANAGTTSGIVISVSDGNGGSASLPAFALTVYAINHAPTIAGTPDSSVETGSPYFFQPAFNDVDGDPLTLSVANKPSWATFDPVSGALSGTPTLADVGTTFDIVITVDDGQGGGSSLPAFALTVIENAGPPLPFAAIAASGTHSAALKPDGSLWSWGSNGNGQIGDGSSSPDLAIVSPLRIGTDTDWTQVVLGVYHSLAIKGDGTLWAWGRNFEGQLGNGTTVSEFSPLPVGDADADGLPDTDWTSVDAGVHHTAAIKSDGSLWTWGGNSEGQLGDGSRQNRSRPVRVGNDYDWKAVAAGFKYTLALKEDGSLWAWGDNYAGQLGDGSTANRLVPTLIGAGTAWRSMAAGSYHALAIDSYGQLWAWGHNDFGQFGDGSGLDSPLPVLVGGSGWHQVAAGYYHSLAIKADGTLWAWGANDLGQLGIGTLQTVSETPVQVGGDSDWRAVAAGAAHSLALKENGQLLAWGNNASGQLGDMTQVDRTSPAETLPDLYDYTPTILTLDAYQTPTSLGAQTFSGTIEAGGTVIVDLDPLLASTVSYPVSGAWECTVSGLLEGENIISFIPVDASNNVGATVQIVVMRDTVAPSLTIAAVTSPTNQTAATISGGFNDNLSVGTVAVSVNTAASVGPVSTVNGTSWNCTISDLQEGVNLVTVVHTDKAGNQTSANTTIILDTLPPLLTAGPLPGLTNQVNQSINGVSEEAATVTVANVTTGAAAAVSRNAADWNSDLSTVLIEGNNLIRVSATDTAGNESVEERSIQLDTTPPTLSVESMPIATNEVNQTLRGTISADAAVTVVNVGTNTVVPVSQTAGSWSAGLSTILAEGSNLFRISAVDLAGNPAESVDLSLELDTQPPSLTLIPPFSPINSASATINGLVELDATVEVVTDTAASDGSATTLDGFWLYEITNLQSGDNQVTVTATDAVGNQSVRTATIVLDQVPPQLSVDAVTTPTNQTSQLLSGTTEAGASVNVASDTSASDGAATVADGNWSYAMTGLVSGDNVITVTAVDAAGNETARDVTIVLDDIPPPLSFGNVASPTNQPNQTLAGTTEAGALVTVQNVGDATAASVVQTGADWNAELAPILVDGANQIRVVAIDPAGNQTVKDLTVVLDTAAPSLTVNAVVSPTNEPNQLLAGTTDTDATVRVENLTSGFSIVVTPSGADWSADLPLTEGSVNLIRITATDSVGNVAAQDVEIELDTASPSLSVDEVASPINQASQLFSGTTDADATITVTNTTTGDSVAAAPGSTGWSVVLSGLAEGDNLVEVTAEDPAGNRTIQSLTISVDTQAPLLQVDFIATLTGRAGQVVRGSYEPGQSVSFSIDNPSAVFGPVSYPAPGVWILPVAAGQGVNSIETIVTDAAGNSSIVISDIIYDPVTPLLTIDTVATPVNQASQTVSGRRGRDAVVALSVDTAASIGPVVYPTAETWSCLLSDMVEGRNAFVVTATDPVNGNSAEAYAAIDYDPSVPALAVEAIVSPTNQPAQTVGGGRAFGATISVTVDPWATAETVVYPDATSWSCALSGLTEASNGVSVVATDEQGLTAAVYRTVEIDTLAPAVTVDAPVTPTTETTVIVTGTVEAGASVAVATDTSASDGAATVAGTSWSFEVTGLVQGANVISVTAVDAAGNPSTAVTVNIYSDNLPPTVNILTPEMGKRYSVPVLNFTVGDDYTGATPSAVAMVDGGPVVANGETLSGLTEGDHFLSVTATDAAGNETFEEVVFTVDTVPPVLTLDAVTSPVESSSLTISGSVEAGATVSVATATAASDGAAIVSGGVWSYEISGLVDGDNVVTVTATDAAGNVSTATATVTRNGDPPQTIGGIGELAVNGTPRSVVSGQTYQDPVVILGPPTLHDAEPGVIRLDNVTGSGFAIRFQEWGYLDNVHADESVSYLVLDKGRYIMEDGSIWEVGTFALSGTKQYAQKSFTQAFAAPPALFLTVQSSRESDAVTPRVRNVTAGTFDVALFEEEGKNDGHLEETIGYLAVYSPQGSGLVGLDQASYPYLLQQRSIGSAFEPVVSSKLKLQEELSADYEVVHAAETVSVLAFGPYLFAQVVSANEADTAALRRQSPEDAAAIEWGALSLTDNGWVTVPLAKAYTAPVVVVKPVSASNAEPGYIQIQNVAPDSFQVRYDEWAGNWDAGQRQPVNVFYLVADVGSQQLGGLTVQAGRLSDSTAHYPVWQRIDFTQAFAGGAPAVFTAVQTASGDSPRVTRVHGCTERAFDVTMQGAEAAGSGSGGETLGWIAVEKGSGVTAGGGSLLAFSTTIGGAPVPVNFLEQLRIFSMQGFSEKFVERYQEFSQGLGLNAYAQRFSAGSPVLIGDLSTANEADTATLVYGDIGPGSIELRVQEETSLDAEVQHAPEEVSIFVAE